jgi:hypothetical protein
VSFPLNSCMRIPGPHRELAVDGRQWARYERSGFSEACRPKLRASRVLTIEQVVDLPDQL